MSLPGADELFRTTGGMGLQSSPGATRRQAGGEPGRVPAPAGESDTTAAEAPEADTAQAAGPAAARAEHTGRDSGAQDTLGDRRAAAAAAADRVKNRQAPEGGSGGHPQAGQARRRGRAAGRRPSGRERHDEKITVYVSAEELMDLEHARLVLRGEHGLAVDRGRIVREAVAVVLADLESRGDASILVRRLRGR
ncbi:hypothetical protein ACZ90_29995 [Streptomyces albus subsp. albus]|nr:hypothetical protein ACZ90_29995 [Streptomyces albus subsp. albus]